MVHSHFRNGENNLAGRKLSRFLKQNNEQNQNIVDTNSRKLKQNLSETSFCGHRLN